MYRYGMKLGKYATKTERWRHLVCCSQVLGVVLLCFLGIAVMIGLLWVAIVDTQDRTSCREDYGPHNQSCINIGYEI